MAQKHEPERLNLNAAQVAGGALAAVTSAVVASRFGVGGTLIGAGLASVVSTTGTTLYSHVLRRTGSRARGVLGELPHHGQHTRRPGDTGRVTNELPHHEEQGDEADSTTTTALSTPTSPPAPPPRPPARRTRRVPIWAVPVVGSVLVFAIALGAITGAEAMTGRPAASWVGGSAPGSGTSVGSLAGGNSSPAPGATPAATTPPTPASTPAQAEPTQEPEPKPSAPATAPASGPSPAASAGSSPPAQATPAPTPNTGRQTPAGGE